MTDTPDAAILAAAEDNAIFTLTMDFEEASAAEIMQEFADAIRERVGPVIDALRAKTEAANLCADRLSDANDTQRARIEALEARVRELEER